MNAVKRETTEAQETKFLNLIGAKVRKKSGKPFKSGEKINTVKGLTRNDHTGNTAFIFEEDDSNVEAWRCVEVLG